ncbi:unnamed protein product, partial [Porites evermanni]
WVLSIVCTSSYFWNPSIYQYSAYITIALCLLISVFSYTKIIFTLHHNQIHTTLQGHNCGQGPPSQSLIIAKYRKAVYSGLWVQGTLFTCYLPHSIAVALTPQRGMHISLYLVRQFTLTQVYFNSSLNPFLYCWKAREGGEIKFKRCLSLHSALESCGQGPPSQSLIIAKYRKAVYTALWVQGTLFICYLLHGVAVALTTQRGMDISLYLTIPPPELVQNHCPRMQKSALPVDLRPSKTAKNVCQDRTRQEETRRDEMRQDRTGQDRTEQAKIRQDRTGQDRTGQDKIGQDRTRQDGTR